MKKLFACVFLFLSTVSVYGVTVFNNTQKPIQLYAIKYHTSFPRPSHDKQFAKEVAIAQEPYKKTIHDVSEIYLRPGQIVTKNQIVLCRLAVKHNPLSWAYHIEKDIVELDDYVGVVISEDGQKNKINVDKFIWEGSTIFNNTNEEITVNYLDSSSQNQILRIAAGNSVSNLLIPWKKDENNEWKRTLLTHFSSRPGSVTRLNGKDNTGAVEKLGLDLLIISVDDQKFRAINHLH